ncbi:DnaJ subfamily C member 1 [Galemys pyrenaicus]|uniref:DnaJ subfamily C member 1 n=1 Tax=Galemys pyrenaicus TaxID=202257 RepID=A0A8J6A6E3_GALPY|nr:DnaJ subfamily C member 1 [Galemys pyrenaicus]
MTAPRSRLAQLLTRRRPGLVPFPPPPLLLLLLLLASAAPACGWESGDLELFDLVEEVQLNFYQFLGVQQVAETWSSRVLAALPNPAQKELSTFRSSSLHYFSCQDPVSLTYWTVSPAWVGVGVVIASFFPLHSGQIFHSTVLTGREKRGRVDLNIYPFVSFSPEYWKE